MAVVPYRPVPNVEAQTAPVRPEFVQTSPQAFSAVGAALEHLGANTGEAGNEVFGRAIAMQDLHNQTLTDQANTTFMSGATKSISDFNSQLGNNAGPVQLDKLQSDLEVQRQQVRASLPNPMAQKQFDLESHNFVGRMFVSAAAHSGSEMRSVAHQTVQAKIQTLKDQLIANPSMYDQNVGQIGDLNKQDAAILGSSPAVTDYNTIKDRSDTALHMLMGVAQSNAITAAQHKQELMKAGILTGDDAVKADDFIGNRANTVATRNISEGLVNGTSTLLGDRELPMSTLLYAIRMRESSNRYDTVGPTLPSGRYKGDHALGAYGVMGNNLQTWLKLVGMQPMTPQAFLHDNAAQDELATKMMMYNSKTFKTTNANDLASIWFTGSKYSDALAQGKHDLATGVGVQKYVTDVNRFAGQVTPLSDKQNFAGDYFAKNLPDRPDVADTARIKTAIAQEQADTAQRMQDRRDATLIQGAINSMIGKGVISMDSLEASSPQVKQRLSNLSPEMVPAVNKAILAAVKNDNASSPARTGNMQLWSGLAQINPEKFLDANFNDVDLANNDRVILQKRQSVLHAEALVDPQVPKAMGQLAGQLSAAGITLKDNPDDYYKFTGALHDAMTDFTTAKGKPPSFDDIQDIGASMLSKYTNPGTHFLGIGASSEEAWRGGVPPAEADKIKAAAGNRPLSDSMIERIYIQGLTNDAMKKRQADANNQ